MRAVFPFLLASWAASPVLGDDPAPAGLAATSLRLSGGKSQILQAPKGGVLVLAFTSTECPISNEYTPALNAIVKDFPADKLRMIAVCVDPDKTDDDLNAHAKEFALAFPTASGRDGKLAVKLGVKVTPEVVVIDAKDRIRYRGRIDDRFPERGKKRANPERHDLRDAVAALLAGREVANPRTEAVGCPIPSPPKGKAAPTE